MYIKRNLSTQKYHMWQPVFSSLDHITSHDHALTSSDLFDLLTSRIDSTKINKSIGMLQVIGKLKKAAFYALYGSASLRSNDWPQADLHWPLMTSKLCILEQMHDTKNIGVLHINCKVLRLSEVNEGQSEVSHLTSNLLRHIMLLSLAFNCYATSLYSYLL